MTGVPGCVRLTRVSSAVIPGTGSRQKDDGTPWWQQDCLRKDALNEWADAQPTAGQAPSRDAKGAVSLESHLPASPGHDMEGSMRAENESEMPADAMTPQQWRGRPALSGSASTVRLPGF